MKVIMKIKRDGRCPAAIWQTGAMRPPAKKALAAVLEALDPRRSVIANEGHRENQTLRLLPCGQFGKPGLAPVG